MRGTAKRRAQVQGRASWRGRPTAQQSPLEERRAARVELARPQQRGAARVRVYPGECTAPPYRGQRARCGEARGQQVQAGQPQQVSLVAACQPVLSAQSARRRTRFLHRGCGDPESAPSQDQGRAQTVTTARGARQSGTTKVIGWKGKRGERGGGGIEREKNRPLLLNS
jgi:hypothetical protein